MSANVAITQDTANPYSESDIAIYPSNVQQIIAVSNANDNLLQLPVYWSHDAGVTWTQTLLPTVSTDNLQFVRCHLDVGRDPWAICNGGTPTRPYFGPQLQVRFGWAFWGLWVDGQIPR